MKKLIKGISLILALVLCFSAGVYAAGNTEVIQALMNYGIVIKFDGQTQNMYNANGKQVFPISYEGTTYVPIRAVSSMLGVDVEWDGPNNTVWLGKTGTAKNFIEMKPYSVSVGMLDSFYRRLPQDNDPQQIADKIYSEYLFTSKGSGYYNLEGKYNVLKFKAYSAPGADINFFGDNDELLSTIEVKGQNLPKVYEVNVTNVTQLKMSINNDCYIFDATIE